MDTDHTLVFMWLQAAHPAACSIRCTLPTSQTQLRIPHTWFEAYSNGQGYVLVNAVNRQTVLQGNTTVPIESARAAYGGVNVLLGP